MLKPKNCHLPQKLFSVGCITRDYFSIVARILKCWRKMQYEIFWCGSMYLFFDCHSFLYSWLLFIRICCRCSCSWANFPGTSWQSQKGWRSLGIYQGCLLAHQWEKKISNYLLCLSWFVHSSNDRKSINLSFTWRYIEAKCKSLRAEQLRRLLKNLTICMFCCGSILAGR